MIKKNAGMATQQNNHEFNIGTKLLKLDKVDSNLNNDVNLGPIKTDLNNNKSLPKIKGNNTMTNFTKKNNNTVENVGKSKKGNNLLKEIETSEQLDMKNYSDDDEDRQPKIMKITKINKE
jgi:ERCC4-related helicase